ncbi:cell wall-binding repeat-containing protein [Clostridium sp. FAM 1755]|uniref:cell wall-binding repeat-containing protein n=1 Tax=Clostridium caseinilyticum TaxID=3350403 RepID=UPI0038F7276A
MNKKGTRALASATVVGLVLATVATGNVKAAPGDVNKVQGKDRYETAANVAKTNWKDGAKDVIIASGNGYADSLSASVLAKKLNAPIILTTAGELNSNAKSALETLKPENVYVIGGNASVSEAVKNGLKKDYKVTELGGKTRFETNLAVANHLVDKLGVKADNVMVVNGQDGFSDALSAAPVAAAKEQVLLIVGKDASTADLAANFVKKHNSKVTVIGTEGVVPAAVYNKLGATERVNGGADRFDTNLNIMKHFKLNADTMYVANATGDGYADALVASALAGKSGAPLVLVDTKDSASTKNAIKYIGDNKTDKTEVSTVGGSGVMPDEIVNEIETAVNPELSAAEKAVKAYEDAKIATSEEIAAAKALKADAVKAVDGVKDATKKSAFQARIAAKDKAIEEAEAKLQVTVEAVKAVNAKEIKVVFNKEVDSNSAENKENYEVYVGGDQDSKKLESSKFKAELQDDNKTVIIRVNDNLENGQSYKLNVKNVIDTKYNKMKDYEGTLKLFQDNDAPKLLDTEYKASTVELTFDEPLATKPTIKIDDVSVDAKDIELSDDIGDYTVTINNLSDKAKELGKHTVKVYGAKDLVENKASLINSEYEATKDNEKPSIKSVKVDSEDSFKVEFNTSAIEKLDTSNFEIKKGSHTFENGRINITQDGNKKFIVKVSKDENGKNPLFEDGENKVTLDVKIKDYKGTNGKVGDTYTTKVVLEKDEDAPIIANDSANTVEDGKLVLVFNEDLKKGQVIENDKIHVLKDGAIQKITGAVVNEDDNNKLEISLHDDNKVSKGTYNITLDKDAVEDKSENKNEAINTKVVYAGNDEVIQPTNISVDSNSNGKNIITVKYENKMDDSAINPENYEIDNIKVSSLNGYVIGFTNKDVKKEVQIILPKGTIEKSGKKSVDISKNVKDEDGRYVADANKKDFSDEVDGFKDDKAPTIDKIQFIKNKDTDDTTNVLKVEFSEIVKPEDAHKTNKDLADDFEIKESGDKVDVKSVTIMSDPTRADKSCAVIALGKDVKIDTKADTVTLKVTDDSATNENGINILDEADNKLEATGKSTLKIKDATRDTKLFEIGKNTIEAQEALQKATDAVEKAEKSKTQADKTAAQTLVTALANGAEKDALQAKLNLIEVVKTDSEKVAAAKEALTLAVTGEDQPTASITLPSTGEEATEITWKADANDVTGTYTTQARTASEQTIILTATIKKGNETETKTFTVTIPAGESGTDAITVAAN